MSEVAFRCNICGAENVAFGADFGREIPSCEGCGSTVRMRSVVRCVSMALFGRSLALPDMVADPAIRGIGLSDWNEYAVRLADLFSYRNTFFDTEPRLDITAPRAKLLGTLDFLIASDVFEHVPRPVERAFTGAFELLKPGGTLILTVPYTTNAETVEHFPELHDPQVLDFGAEFYLVDRRRDGSFRTFDDLVFHGGPGQTLEMRIFCEADLLAQLERAGFGQIQVRGEDDPASGVIQPVPWSLPVTAVKPRSTRRAKAGAAGSEPILPESLSKAEAVRWLGEEAGIAIGNPWLSAKVGDDVARISEALGAWRNTGVRFVSHQEVPEAAETRVFGTPTRRFPPPRWANLRHETFEGLPDTDYPVETPGFRILSLPGAYLCNFLEAPAVVAADGNTVIADYSSNYAGLMRFHPKPLRECLVPAPYIDGTVVLIADDVQAANIFHWTIDWLPRLAPLGARRYSPDLFVATGRIGADFQRESLRLCGIDMERVIPLENFAAVRARQIIVPSDIARIVHPGSKAAPWVLDYLRATLGFGALGEAAPRRDAAHKIYISRRDAGSRRIVNEAELSARLAKAGYREVLLSEMPLAEQIATFASASRVVAVHGAGLIHFAFTPPGARLLEILPKSYAIPTLYMLAAGMGREYLSYVAERVVAAADPAFDDIEIDVDDFEARCRDFYE
jgi:capsular polysaccharide biosynthesis protein/SAM-dependent methyltransferase